MNSLYSPEEYCMNFTNEEIIKFFINNVENLNGVEIKISSDDEDNLSLDTSQKIRYVSLDGSKENFYISFCDNQTAIFILNEEFMFIDDESKNHYTSSDTHGNIVYEGTLRDKSHEEILMIFCEVVKMLLGTEKINVTGIRISQEGIQYPKCNYIVKLTKGISSKNRINFKNIMFLINE